MPLIRILLAADGSEDATLASKAAADLSAKTGAELHVVHAWHLPAMVEPAPLPFELYEEKLALRAEDLARTTGTLAETRLAEGDGATAILNACEDDPVTLAAVGARGHSLVRRDLLGGVSTKVLRAASGPVLVHATPLEAAASGSAGMVDSAARG